MPNVEIKDGQIKEIKNSSSKKIDNLNSKEIKEDETQNKWINIFTSKFHLILIGIIILLAFLLYRAYTSE